MERLFYCTKWLKFTDSLYLLIRPCMHISHGVSVSRDTRTGGTRFASRKKHLLLLSFLLAGPVVITPHQSRHQTNKAASEHPARALDLQAGRHDRARAARAARRRDRLCASAAGKRASGQVDLTLCDTGQGRRWSIPRRPRDDTSVTGAKAEQESTDGGAGSQV